MMGINRSWVLQHRPEGPVGPDHFAMVESMIPDIEPGQVLVENLYLAMDPAIRNFLNDNGGYAVPVAIGAPIRGMVLGRVHASGDANLRVGDLVWGFGTWSDYSLSAAAGLIPVQDPQGDLADYLHRRGTIGLTAHYGIFDIARVRPGDQVLISGAAGAVGSLAAQMARLAGAVRVVGIAGGVRKCARVVEEYGCDACIDYKAGGDIAAHIRAQMPQGVDVYFDNVGGKILEAAIGQLNDDGRVAICGMISGYDERNAQPGPSNLWNLVVHSATIRGFRVTSILGNRPLVASKLAQIDTWIDQGALRADYDVRHGLEGVPAAFASLFDGSNDGRLLVRLG